MPMNPAAILLTAVLAPLACGLVGLVLPRQVILPRVLLTLLGPIVALVILGRYVREHGLAGGAVFEPWMPNVNLDLAFNADPLGVFFALLVAAIGVAIVLYARAYFGPDKDSLYRFYPCLMLFMTAMLGVALSDNLLLLLLFWEMTSISSFLLIGWERDDPAAVKKAMQAFVVTGAGGLALMAGLILVGVHTGQWTFSGLLANAHLIDGSTTCITAFVLIFVGAAAKSAQFPVHFWLPGAMAAPTPVSAYLHSATMVKAGVYLVGRIWPIITADAAAADGPASLLMPLVITLGAVTMVYGAFIALQKTDLKQIFAYTTVSQLGLLMCMFGLSGMRFDHDGHTLVNSEWCVTQILNHALYKAPLFILAGAIGHVAATRELPELRGLYRRGSVERIMTIVLLLAAYAMAAGPLTLSFTAKEFFFYQIWHGYEATHSPWFYPLMLLGVATGTCNVAIFIRLFRVLVLGHNIHTPRGPVKPDAHVSEVAENLEVESGHAADARAHEDAHSHHHAHGAHGAHASHGAHGHGHGHGDHGHETGFWPAFLWVPGLIIVAFQFLGGFAPPVFESLFGWLELHAATSHHAEHSLSYFPHIPSILYLLTHPGVPLLMSVIGIAAGIALGCSSLLSGVFADPHDKIYPAFYLLATKGGGRVFRILQTGNARSYVAFVTTAIVLVFGWSIGFSTKSLEWPALAVFEPFGLLMPGYFITVVVCVATLLLPVVKGWAPRVLVLGCVGFSVTALYYYCGAADLALTQVSIEIISLILFLLVLKLLPDVPPRPQPLFTGRVLLSLCVGFVMFWLVLTSATAERPVMAYVGHDGQRVSNLGEYFLRNSKYSLDTALVAQDQVYGGVVDRGPEHLKSFGTGKDHMPDWDGQSAVIHKGGGGANPVNVAIVDFRGFDTMGEITVLGLAAMGVWTMLRRRGPRRAA